ncbi:MAG: discoidin domain-containing protein [Muribaculaceae bacterium]|nr:discoidin domain-containing protein [Muribaculaceae bacterium]
MKKIFLTLFISLLCFDSFASVNLTPIWRITNENILNVDSPCTKSPIAVDGDGNVYVTGAFDQDFRLADYDLKAKDRSAYLAKYDRHGNVKWAIALTGLATITHLELTENGLIYIAGQFSGELLCNSINDSFSQYVLSDAGKETKNQNSAFILVYTKDGRCEGNWIYTAEPTSNLSPEVVYTPDEEEIFFQIQDFLLLNGDLYLAASYAGSVNCNSNPILDGEVCEVNGKLVDVKRAVIFSLQDGVVANFASEDYLCCNSKEENILSICKEKDEVYVSYSGVGNIEMQTPIVVFSEDKTNWNIIECNSDIRNDPAATEMEKQNNNPNALIDGTTSMWWRSIYRYYQELPYYAIIDFNEEISIDNFTFEIPSSSNMRYANSKYGHLEISNDNLNWKYLCDWESLNAVTRKISVDFNTISTRYLKFVIDKVFKDVSTGNINNPNATAVGELSVGCKIGGEQRCLNQSENKASLILSAIYNYSFDQVEVEQAEDGFRMFPCRILNEDNCLYIIGYELNNDLFGRMCFIKVSKGDLFDRKKMTFEETDGNVSFYEIMSVVLTDNGEVIVTVKGRYNKDIKIDETKSFQKGDFANITKTFILINDELVPITGVEGAIGVSMVGPYIAMSHIGESGNGYSLNRISITGVEDILNNEDDEVVYYNLQGLKVSMPNKGIYIVKKGNVVTKEIIN